MHLAKLGNHLGDEFMRWLQMVLQVLLPVQSLVDFAKSICEQFDCLGFAIERQNPHHNLQKMLFNHLVRVPLAILALSF